jgi:hypothetical protein
MRRALFCSGLLCLSLSGVMLAGQSATEVKLNRSEKLLGKWKQLPPDKPTLTKVEPEGSGIKVSYGCKEDGSCSSSVSGNYAGKRSKFSDNASWETSFRKMDDGTIQQESYFHGKLDNTDKWQLSVDRSTLTVTNQEVSHPESKAVRFVYERSGGLASSDDPFVGSWKRDWDKSDANVLAYAAKGDVFTITNQRGVTDERHCDGKDHPNKFLAGVVYSCGFPDERTYELVIKDKGKVTATITSKISEDGTKMARTVKDGEGKITSELTLKKVQ